MFRSYGLLAINPQRAGAWCYLRRAGQGAGLFTPPSNSFPTDRKPKPNTVFESLSKTILKLLQVFIFFRSGQNKVTRGHKKVKFSSFMAFAPNIPYHSKTMLARDKRSLQNR